MNIDITSALFSLKIHYEYIQTQCKDGASDDGPKFRGLLWKVNYCALNKYFQGNMDNIMDEIPCSTIDDEPRFREFLQNAIDEGKIKSYKVII